MIFVSMCLINNGIRINLSKICKYKEKYPDYRFFRKVLICKGFRSLNEIKIYATFVNNSLDYIVLIPRFKIILEHSLDLSKLFYNNWIQIVLSNFKGFELESSPFLNVSTNKMNQFGSLNLIFLQLFNSNFEFYFKLKTINKCDNNYFPDISTSPFSGVNILQLNPCTKYPEYICPLVLQNLNLTGFSFFLTISFVKKSLIKFREFNSTIFRTEIKQTFLHLYKITVDSSLLNQLVFGRNTGYICIFGILNEIQTDIFRTFTKLKYLSISIENLMKFFHKGLKWLNYLETGDVKLNQFLYLHLNTSNLKFLDEDFCLFVKVPDKTRLIIVLPPIENKV